MKSEELDSTNAELTMRVSVKVEREGEGATVGSESEEMRSTSCELNEPVRAN